MKNSILVIVTLVLCGSISTSVADHFNFVWGSQFGTGATDNNVSMAIDSTGHIYNIWITYDGSITTTYIRKTTPNGTVLWQKSEQRNYMEYACHIKIDTKDNLYILGYTDGPSGGYHYGWRDGFIRKYNSDCQLLWSRQLGTSNYDTILNGTTDAQGNIYVCGETYGSLAGSSTGWANSVVAKYDPNGVSQWVKQYDVYSYYDQAGSIAVSSTGEIYVGVGAFNNNSVNDDKFILQLGSNGNLIWTRNVGLAGGHDGGLTFTGFDSLGRLLFFVEAQGALGGTYKGGWDVALGRCDTNGTVVWLGQYGSPENDFVGVSLVGPSDTIIVVGYTFGSLFNSTRGSSDAFIMQIDPNGNLLGGDQLGTSGFDVLTGLYGNSAVFFVIGNTTGALWPTSVGDRDIILARFTLAPSNDDKVNAIPLLAGDVVEGWTIGATGTDITLNGYNDSLDVWYYFEPQAKGKYTIQSYNSTFDTTLAVFDENNKEVEFNDDFWGDKSVVILKAKAGKRYYIRIAGYDEETGNFTLSVQSGAIQPIQGDLNYDGDVNMDDLSALAQNWMGGGN